MEIKIKILHKLVISLQRIWRTKSKIQREKIVVVVETNLCVEPNVIIGDKVKDVSISPPKDDLTIPKPATVITTLEIENGPKESSTSSLLSHTSLRSLEIGHKCLHLVFNSCRLKAPFSSRCLIALKQKICLFFTDFHPLIHTNIQFH